MDFKNKWMKRGYISGYALGLTLCVCSIITIIALTVKLLTWVF